MKSLKSEMICHPEFIRIDHKGKTFARASLLIDGTWGVYSGPGSSYKIMTKELALRAMEAAALLVVLEGI